MSKDFEYDPETGSFRFDEAAHPKRRTTWISAAGS